MKKVLSFTLSVIMLFTLSIPAFAAEPTALSTNQLYEMAKSNATISNNLIQYETFTVNNQEIRLFTETTLTSTEAIENYHNAYNLIAISATGCGISSSLDDPTFQEYAKSFVFYEGGTPELNQEVQEFGKFMDIYENTAKNQDLLQTLSSSNPHSADEIDLDSLMPITGQSTIESGQSSDEEPSTITRATSYDTKAVVNYASAWWIKPTTLTIRIMQNTIIKALLPTHTTA